LLELAGNSFSMHRVFDCSISLLHFGPHIVPPPCFTASGFGSLEQFQTQRVGESGRRGDEPVARKQRRFFARTGGS
jgi:hypothetical protein